MRIAITGANSSVGRNLLEYLAGQAAVSAVAVVRSASSIARLPEAENISPAACTYEDVDGLGRIFAGADCIVHLAGVLFEAPGSTYKSANVDTTAAVVEAAKQAGVAHIVFISVLGADASSANAYFRSKGQAEALVTGSGLAATVLRTSILMSRESAGGQALLRSASQGSTKVLGGGHYALRPLDVDDLSRAIVQACGHPPPQPVMHELAGPEAVPYNKLIQLMAAKLGREVSISSIPVWSARLFSGLSYTVRKAGMSPAIIEVITSSETLGENADRALGIELTPLSDTLDKLAMQTESIPAEPAIVPAGRRRQHPLGRVVFLLLTVACFSYLYYRLNGAAAREGLGLVAYMSGVFANVQWIPWLLLMICYSCFYFLIDTLVVSRALNWFIANIRYRDLLPIRACAYIISIFNEQIGKGAMAYYLNRRDGVPGWEVGSVMLFIMFCEIFYLLIWATAGYFLSSSILPDVFSMIPWIAMGAGIFFTLWLLYFQGTLLKGSKFRERRILHAFRLARLKHYGMFLLLRSPALLMAVFVYSVALNLFGVEASFLGLLGFLPVIFFAASVPTPMRAAAITLWVVLFPDNEGQMAAFGFVQHNFFILFNALIGLLFWRRAQRDLFGPSRVV